MKTLNLVDITVTDGKVESTSKPKKTKSIADSTADYLEMEAENIIIRAKESTQKVLKDRRGGKIKNTITVEAWQAVKKPAPKKIEK